MKLAFFTLLAVLILVKYTSAEGFEYYEEEVSEELLCSSNEECLEMNSNKPICRENYCQPECTPLAPCPIGQSCIDGRCNIEKDVEEQPTIINKGIQVNPVDLPIVKKIPLEKDKPQGSKRKADHNFRGETTTEAGDYSHMDEIDDHYNDYFTDRNFMEETTSEALANESEYFEEGEEIEELLCLSNKECLEMNSNKPICRQNNCQPECTRLAPCPIGQSCIDGRCNIESDVQDQPTIINKVIQVNPVDLRIAKKMPAEKAQGSKHRGDRNFKEETTTEAGDYYHTDYSNYDDYNDEGTDYYNDEETSKGSDGNISYNFYQFSRTDNLIVSDQNIG